VLMATGRRPATLALNLHYAGVNIDDSGKVFASKPGKWHESTDNERVFAIGDCMRGNPELTPVPTTIFTPLEYACVGLSEDAAIGEYGEDGIE
ncbi:TXNRD2, partial [Symbiodinium sp. KB8]